jgi:hypothetical protein
MDPTNQWMTSQNQQAAPLFVAKKRQHLQISKLKHTALFTE